MTTLVVEPGSRLFRIRDRKGVCHELSAYYLREALHHDGTCFPEDLPKLSHVPEVTAIEPWQTSGTVRDFDQAVGYLRLVRHRFESGFRKSEWSIVVSPILYSSQRQIWSALLKEASIRKFRFYRNLDVLSQRRTQDAIGMFFHYGATGGDLGVCLQGETYRYQRLSGGQTSLVNQFHDWLGQHLDSKVSRQESYRVFKVVAESGFHFPQERLVEVNAESSPSDSLRVSVEQEILFQAVLDLMRSQVEILEAFVRRLTPEDQGELFRYGLFLSGSELMLPIWRDYLAELFEFPVHIDERSGYAVIEEF